MVKGCYFSSRWRGSHHRWSEATLNSKHDKETEARNSKNQAWRSQMQLEWRTTTRSYTCFGKRSIQLASSTPTETLWFHSYEVWISGRSRAALRLGAKEFTCQMPMWWTVHCCPFPTLRKRGLHSHETWRNTRYVRKDNERRLLRRWGGAETSEVRRGILRIKINLHWRWSSSRC